VVLRTVRGRPSVLLRRSGIDEEGYPPLAAGRGFRPSANG
jgi:hypothetical protein